MVETFRNCFSPDPND
ncbi:hypothetical protein A2U01_0006464, partial [Trifolium medium]|nr:hypothetical protein [Trifolium medium]